MSILARVLTLILAVSLLSFTGLACGANADDVRQIAAEQLEIAAKKLANPTKAAPEAVDKRGAGSGEISIPEDFSGTPQFNPSQASTGTLEKDQDDAITISIPKDPLGTPQLIPSQDLPDSKDKSDAPQAAPSTGVKTTVAKGETAPDKTSIDGKQTASDTILQIRRTLEPSVGHPSGIAVNW